MGAMLAASPFAGCRDVAPQRALAERFHIMRVGKLYRHLGVLFAIPLFINDLLSRHEISLNSKWFIASLSSGKEGKVMTSVFVQDAEGCQPPPIRNGVIARVVAPLLGLILATLTCPAPVLAGAYSASGYVLQEFYAAGPPGASSESPTGATFTQQFVAGDINLNSHAEASSGSLSLFALASINGMTNWDSGHVWSVARSRIVESVAPNWSLWMNPGETFLFNYKVSVSGALLTTIAGYGAVGSDASLAYSYRVGDSMGSGNWSQNAAGQGGKNGTWNGVITGTFTVHQGSTFDLELLAEASTMGTKNYSPGGNATIVASADFSHTMTWLGITGVQAFDSGGNGVPLPSDFYLPLIGQDSGFDYWYSAAVPEPANLLLLASGLAIVGLRMKLVARRRDSQTVCLKTG